MKLAAPLAIVSALLLTGCSDDTESAPEPGQTATTADTDQPASIGHRTASQDDEDYYMTIFEDDEVASSLSEEEQLYTGYRICEHLLHGEIVTPDERDHLDETGIAREVQDIDVESITKAKLYLIDRVGDRLDHVDHDVMMFAASHTLCPTVQDQLTEEAQDARPFNLAD